MPEHGHGLPTQREVTQDFGDGSYLVAGMRFQMGGQRYVEFAIATPDGAVDTVRFNLQL